MGAFCNNTSYILSLVFLSFHAYFMTMSQSASAFVPTRTATTTTSNNNRKKHHAQHDMSSIPRPLRTTTRQYATTTFPRLIVLDLDNTIWTPELYQLRKYQQLTQTPVAGRDVQLFPGAAQLFDYIRQGHYFPSTTQFAVASRTTSVDWAHALLTQFELRQHLSFVEIFPGTKIQHFENLARHSGVPYHEMMFLDDARSGKYGNCEPVADLGVLSIHTPKGLTSYEIFETALQRYHEWDRQPGTIVEWDGTVSNVNVDTAVVGERMQGMVKMVNVDKRYGFIQTKGKRDVFFHFSSLPDSVNEVCQGDRLSFVCERDPKNNGKSRATKIQLVGDGESPNNNQISNRSSSKNNVRLPCFSMNMPFAALLANGYKTLETRNGTMFVPFPKGTQMLLHVGRRTYPDGDKHLEIMRNDDSFLMATNDDTDDDDNDTDKKITKLKSLPAGFGKGMVVAIVELGKTYETTVQERSDPAVQRQVVAYGKDSGKMVTEIRRVAYLKRPIPVPGQAGVFTLDIDSTLLPDGWTTTSVSENKYRVGEPRQKVTPKTKTKNGGPSDDSSSSSSPPKKPIYSITG